MSIKEMKYLLFISILLLTVSCSQPNNGFEVDSAEAIAGLKTDLKLTELDIAKENSLLARFRLFISSIFQNRLFYHFSSNKKTTNET